MKQQENFKQLGLDIMGYLKAFECFLTDAISAPLPFRFRTGPVIGACVLLLSSAAGHLRAAVDLTVTGIEVNQAIQTAGNTIALVAQRSTAVRAMIGVSGSAVPVVNVTGRLHVFVGGAEITPAAGVLPINAPFTAPLAPQRANENDTLNFELMAPTGISASSAVNIRVDVTPVPGEANTGNNSMTLPNLTFVNRVTPLLYFTRINYGPSGLGAPSDALILPGVGDAFVRGILPVNDGDPLLYQQGLFPSLNFGEDANGDGVLDACCLDGDGCPDGSHLLDLLEACRQLIVDSGVAASERIFLFGWLAGNPIDGNGLAQVGGRVAFGNTQDVRYQRSYAHELTHNFGFNHVNDPIGDIGWDVRAKLPNNPAGNNTTGRLKASTLFDVQVAGRLTAQAWVSTSKYNTLLSDATLTGGGAGSDSTNVFVIRGRFDPLGKTLEALNPVFRFPWFVQPSRVKTQGTNAFVLTVTDSADNQISTAFNALLGDDNTSTNHALPFGSFAVRVPLAAGRVIQALSINTLNGKELGSLTRTRLSPKVTILAPLSGAQLGAKTTLKLDVSDEDSLLDDLQYQIAYSPNDGKSWVPLAVNVPGKSMTLSLNTTEIQETRGRGRIRVFASDGLNTSFAEVARLTPLSAIYENPAEPRLRLARSKANFVLSWPVASSNFVLQSSLKLTDWADETSVRPTIVSNRFTVVLPAEKGAHFFRLQQ